MPRPFADLQSGVPWRGLGAPGGVGGFGAPGRREWHGAGKTASAPPREQPQTSGRRRRPLCCNASQVRGLFLGGRRNDKLPSSLPH
eukprot:5614204-Pyramimonas_sp.AAC.1